MHPVHARSAETHMAIYNNDVTNNSICAMNCLHNSILYRPVTYALLHSAHGKGNEHRISLSCGRVSSPSGWTHCVSACPLGHYLYHKTIPECFEDKIVSNRLLSCERYLGGSSSEDLWRTRCSLKSTYEIDTVGLFKGLFAFQNKSAGSPFVSPIYL
jgi:hypothetical protein